ncbi:MAG: metallophosphoesterase [Gemmatimonadota bacterium]
MARSRRSRLALSLLLAGGACALLALRPQEPRLTGEFGLFVWEMDDSVHVQWITADALPGLLRVIAGGHPHFTTNTPAATAHHAVFRKPKGAAFEITYGSAGNTANQQRTVLYRDPLDAPAALQLADSVYVLGDTHGEFDGVVRLLRNAGLIDDSLRWSGGRKQIVFLGDMVDRGPDATRLLWFLYRLEREARAANGRVHVLLGNHEIMVMLGDLRYVHPKESHIAHLHNSAYSRLLHARQSVLGRWLAGKPAVLKLGDLLFVHGGVSSDYLNYTPASLARELAHTIRSDLFLAHTDSTVRVSIDSASLAEFERFFWGDRSVFWYRGYAQSDTLEAELTTTLARFHVQAQVIGHTPAQTIQRRYGGKLIVAHPRRAAAEMLLITGQSPQRRFYRIPQHGPAELLAR